MSQTQIKEEVQGLLRKAGIKVGGPNPWDIQVYDDRFYQRVLAEGSIGLGDSYMDKWWDVQHLDELFYLICRSGIETENHFTWSSWLSWLQAIIFNKQSKKRSLDVAERHYDLGNDLFVRMLDKRLTYSCAYWKTASNLDEAQEAKLELICQKLNLQPGMKVLDIGCGWGSFAKYAAEKYQVHVTGITISEQQLQLAKEICEGLPIEIQLKDYRDITGTYDRIVSIGQMEHVGYKNYKNFCRIVHPCLKDDGLFLLHTIGNVMSQRSGDPWLEKHIFPNGMLPSIKQLGASFEELFVLEDWHSFGAYYDNTLMSWHQNFISHWHELQPKYDEKFFRMWNYYLLSCAGAFRARKMQLWQIVLSKRGIVGGYNSIR
jgi:cyclopropane-fatty-acyl-phospholipid synthase